MTAPARPQLHQALVDAGWVYRHNPHAGHPHYFAVPPMELTVLTLTREMGGTLKMFVDGRPRVWRMPIWAPDEVILAAAEAARVWAGGQAS